MRLLLSLKSYLNNNYCKRTISIRLDCSLELLPIFWTLNNFQVAPQRWNDVLYIGKKKSFDWKCNPNIQFIKHNLVFVWNGSFSHNVSEKQKFQFEFIQILIKLNKHLISLGANRSQHSAAKCKGFHDLQELVPEGIHIWKESWVCVCV